MLVCECAHFCVFSISQASAADSQASAARIAGLQLELEDLGHRDSTLAQQLDQFQQAITTAKDNLDKMRSVFELAQTRAVG